MDNIYAIATAAAKKAGYSNFDKGSDGEEKREEIVLALKRRGMKKASYVRDEQGHKIAGQRISGKYPNRLRYLREAARYQDRKPEKPIIEQREPADTPKKDPNRAKGGEWKSGKWESKSMWELWKAVTSTSGARGWKTMREFPYRMGSKQVKSDKHKNIDRATIRKPETIEVEKATYGAKNDQARHFGQRTNVKRNPRLNPNKLGVSDIIKARLPKQAPLRKPKIVDEGLEDDLYPTGSQFSVDRKDQVKKSLLGLLLRNATFEVSPEGVARETKPGAAKAKVARDKEYTQDYKDMGLTPLLSDGTPGDLKDYEVKRKHIGSWTPRNPHGDVIGARGTGGTRVKKSLLRVLLKAKMRGLGFGAIKTDQENRGKIAQMTDTERKDQRQKLLQERARLVAHRDTLVEKVEKLKSSPKTPAPQPKPDSGEGSEAEEYFRQRI